MGLIIYLKVNDENSQWSGPIVYPSLNFFIIVQYIISITYISSK